MTFISPSLTATSSSTRPGDISNLLELDLAMGGFGGNAGGVDINDLFNFEEYDSANDSHSQTTVSPNRTPSPLPSAHHEIAIAQPGSPSFTYNQEIDFSSFDFMNEKQPELFQTFDNNSGPSGFPYMEVEGTVNDQLDVLIKQEPMEMWDSTKPTPTYQNIVAPTPIAPESAVIPSADPINYNGLPIDQQAALQQLMFNIMSYQSKFGFESSDVAPVGMDSQQQMPTTVNPNMIFSQSNNAAIAGPSKYTPNFSNLESASSASEVSNNLPIQSTSTSYSSSAPSVSATTAPASIPEEDEDDDEALISIDPHEDNHQHEPINPSSRARAESTFSSFGADENVDARLDRLAPLASIFSAGKGKGGKKGGGLSSVVRQEDEDVDDDDSWRPSPEEYKKLSSKEKRQLRNKLSARAFRNRRKDYIGTLEGHIKERDGVIDDMKAELITSRTENQDLRKELAALKASTMSILHPKSAVNNPTPPILQAFSMSPNINLPAVAGPSTKRTPTPVFNPRKDLGVDSKTRWGNENLFGGGSTICHTILTPDISLPASFASKPALSPYGMPRANINPLLPTRTKAAPTVNRQQPGSGQDLTKESFADWSETNAWSIRSMDSYRMQMWGRLAREAASDKAGLEGTLRPKFFVNPSSTSTPTASSSADDITPATAAKLATASAAHITSKLAASFWSAFQSSSASGGIDTDKLTAVVTGKARLRVIHNELDEKSQRDEDEIIAALGGMRLQGTQNKISTGGGGAREDPLRALGGLFGLGMTLPTRV